MRPLLVVAVFFVLGSASSSSLAQQTDVIHACVAKSNGKVRIVANAGMCQPKEAAVEWNQSGPGTAPFKFVGFTTATVGSIGQLNAGMLEWTRACRAEFTGSRVCKTEEVILAVDPPQIVNPDDSAWVIPTVVAPNTDISGAPFGQSCAYISNSNSSGLTVDGHGRYNTAPCTEAHRIACCVPNN